MLICEPRKIVTNVDRMAYDHNYAVAAMCAGAVVFFFIAAKKIED